MSDWKQSAAKRRDARNARGPDRKRPPPSKKDTKRWCRGKVGVEHKTVCKDYREVKGLGTAIPGFAKKWRLLICTECGKELATHYSFGKREKPDWVTF